MSTLKRTRTRRKRKVGELTRQQTIEVAKVARNVVSRTGESKFYYFEISDSPLGAAYTSKYLSLGLAQGDTEQTRVGRDIMVHSLDVRLTLDNSPNATSQAFVRVALIRTKTLVNVDSSADFIQNHGSVPLTVGQYAIDLLRSCSVLYDRTHFLAQKDADAGGAYYKHVHIYKKWRNGRLCQWLQNGLGSVGQFYLLLISDNGTLPNVTGESLIMFKDN